MTSCASCDTAIVKGAPRVSVQNCERHHLFHPPCASSIGPYTLCPGCLISCQLCQERVSTGERVSLCDDSNHHVYHADCLKVADLGATSNCPACAKEDRASRISSPCAACGERVRGTSWTLNSCDHGMHLECIKPWYEKRIDGCIPCGQARPICPACACPFEDCGGHVLARCPNDDCRTRVFKELIGKHDCTLRLFGDKPCFACARPVSEHEGSPCRTSLVPFMRWDRSRVGHFLYVCPLCSKAVPDLTAHFSEDHRPVRCKRCNFAVSKHATREHLKNCGGSKICPAAGCTTIVSITLYKRAERDPKALWEDHKCGGLYECPFLCGAFFYLVDRMRKHAKGCISTVPRSGKRSRRAAFERSKEIILTCSSFNQVDE